MANPKSMKDPVRSKPRKIVVENNEYMYVIAVDNDMMTHSYIELKLFLKNQKRTPFIVQFASRNVRDVGQQLYAGIPLENKIKQTTDIVNPHEPKWVRKFILHGIKMGWTGKNEIARQDGYEILGQWGYDVSKIPG